MDFKSLLKRLSVPLTLGALALAIIAYQGQFNVSSTVQSDKKELSNPQEFYIDQLAQEEQEVWKAIEAEYGISKAEFDQKYNEYVPEYNQAIKDLETGVAVPAEIETLV